MGIITILWEKWVEFRRDFYKITLAAMIAPMMYLLVFGLGVQNVSHGKPYLLYLIPGVVSLTTMNGSFNAIAQNLNVQRLYEKAFDQVMSSPTPLWQFVLGQILQVDTPAGFIRQLGDYAVDEILPTGTHTSFFATKAEALAYAEQVSGNFQLRETVLEDVFIARSLRARQG